MANVNVFHSKKMNASKLAVTNTHNLSKAPAYAFTAKHHLAQVIMTGSLNTTFYASAEDQLATVLKLTHNMDDRFIAQAAIYSRQCGYMKDMPTLLTAILAQKQSKYLSDVFNAVIDNGKMLRNFVQILRSGAVGRKSLGTRPKRLIQNWLNTATENQLLNAAVGKDPSLADILKMTHPVPNTTWREAFFKWVLDKRVKTEDLPERLKALRLFESGVNKIPDVPFQLLTHRSLTPKNWAQIAENMGWHAVRINLNTLARNQVFSIPKATATIASKLKDAALIKKSKVYPYQILCAYLMAENNIPDSVKEALQTALEISLKNVPKFYGNVIVCPDVSGSMSSPITGYRKGATTSVRCIDVAALISAAIMRKQPKARIMPFECNVVKLDLNPQSSVMTNAQKLAKIGGGGTNCSAPLKALADEGAKVDMLIMVSDNESWVDAKRQGATETMRQWQRIKKQNPQARMICIDLQPYATTQAKESPDILNIGGFGDSVFDVMNKFSANQHHSEYWVSVIEEISLKSMNAPTQSDSI